MIAIIAQFWRLRSIAESTLQFAKRYCKNNNLQYISLARIKTQITFRKGKVNWLLIYQLDFSSDGETSYQGYIECIGKQIQKIDLPAYKIPYNE